MTDTDAAPPIDPFAPDALNAVEGLDPVDPAYRHVLRIAAALNAVPLAIGASVADAVSYTHLDVYKRQAAGAAVPNDKQFAFHRRNIL